MDKEGRERGRVDKGRKEGRLNRERNKERRKQRGWIKGEKERNG